ncbi:MULTISPECIES: hypothetical protein [unclassified Haladaptatus]|nr:MULTISPECIES: hypothetical protein [unclassified Haladaptatus]
MRLRTRSGDSVDPVPFLVALCTSFLFVFSAGPVYGLTLGYSLAVSVAASTLLFLGCAALCYHQLVWTARPDLTAEIPVEFRVRRLFVAILLVVLLLVLVNIPFL